ncbi:MAG: DUF4336 domain-containing protein [Gammaproteobacteria bacterium]|nr:DUF4336 domain-containing protein [Gammaproteobacteria bacterium]
MFKQLDAGLWVYDEPLSSLGVQFGNRTTIVKLDNNKLLLHSPGRLGDKLKNTLASLGTVNYIVAPNRFHSLFFDAYPNEYPQVEIFMAPGLDKKRRNVPCSGILDNAAHPAWASHLQQCLIQGMPIFNEVVFFHQASKTLILTDLILNMQPPYGIMNHIHLMMHKAKNGFSFSRILAWMIRNEKRFSHSIQTMLQWDFERVIVSHGEIVESGGKALLKKTFSNYL